MGCRSILGEGLHLGKVRQLKVTRDVRVVPKPLPVKKGGYDRYFAVHCFSLFVSMWIIFIGRNGGKEYFVLLI